MDVQASAVVKGCFYQLRQLRSVRRSLTVDVRRAVVTAFVGGRLDYCNAVLYGAAKTATTLPSGISYFFLRLSICKFSIFVMVT